MIIMYHVYKPILITYILSQINVDGRALACTQSLNNSVRARPDVGYTGQCALYGDKRAEHTLPLHVELTLILLLPPYHHINYVRYGRN